jgi:predicted metal-dependent peptidase
MVDTSGSIEDEDLAIVYSEIRGAIEQFVGKLTGKLGFFDAAVTPPLPFENVGDLMNIIPYGGGGTDFTVIFDYIRNNYRDEFPACIVIFTDGNGPYPSQAEAMGIPVFESTELLTCSPASAFPLNPCSGENIVVTLSPCSIIMSSVCLSPTIPV